MKRPDPNSFPPVYGIWHGGHNYSNIDPDHSIERFDSMEDVKNALMERYESNGQRRVRFDFLIIDEDGDVIDVDRTSTLVPCVDETSCIDILATLNGTPRADLIVGRVSLDENGEAVIEP